MVVRGMNRRSLVAMSGAILAGMAGCLGDDETNDIVAALDASDERIQPDVTADEIAELAAANTAFAFDLHAQLRADEPAADHFLSPFSLSMALAMTWAGARGETEEAMADVLQFPFDQETLHEAFNGLDRAVAERSEIETSADDDPPEINIANAIWPDEAIELEDEFEETLAANYGARPYTLDFENENEAAELINDWVATETEDRIEDLVDPSHLVKAKLVLTNAIYFLASWRHPFDEDRTDESAFRALDGSREDVPMMTQEGSFPYAAFDGHQAIELPYVGDDLSMVVLLPQDGEFESFEAELDSDRWREILSALDRTRGRIDLPRFELETTYELPKQLSAMGMEIAFSPAADFTGMGIHVWIETVLHDAFVAVDEAGTEAAAATAVVMATSESPPSQFEMVVDRPFLFAIRDRPTDSILFLGRVVNPPTDPG